jgi:hypothetical protein
MNNMLESELHQFQTHALETGNIVQFYSNVTQKTLSEISRNELQNKIGKTIVVEYTNYYSDKNYTQNIAYIGKLLFCDEHDIIFENCYYLDKNTLHFYPTTPSIRTTSTSNVTKVYCEIDDILS